MHLERLVIDAGGRTLATGFHPQLTVVSGPDAGMREALVGEILSSMGGARPGVHLELTAAGRSLTVFRPTSGRHRVVDTDAVEDVTDAFTNAAGEIDLFGALGTSAAHATAAMRLDRESLVLREQTDEWVNRLSKVPQGALWEAATRAASAEALLERVSSDTGTSTHDAALVQRIEAVHADLVEATETYDRIRLIALTLGTVGALGAAGSAATDAGTLVIPLLLAAITGAVLGFWFRRNVNLAEAAERGALEQAGADDYSSFHFERVSGLLDNDNARRRFMLAVSDHGRAMQAFAELAGDVPLHVALEHQDRIRAAAGLQSEMGTYDALGAVTTSADRDITNELAQALVRQLDALRALSPNDLLPLVVDDPFQGLSPAEKPLLLELLRSPPDGPQVIVVTSDPDVIDWARLEAMTGDVAVAEPLLGAAVPA